MVSVSFLSVCLSGLKARSNYFVCTLTRTSALTIVTRVRSVAIIGYLCSVCMNRVFKVYAHGFSLGREATVMCVSSRLMGSSSSVRISFENAVLCVRISVLLRSVGRII